MASSRGSLAQRLQRAWLTRGPLAWALLPLALLYAWIAALRRAGYGLSIFSSQRVGASVIVVGNLIAGGAGKTPTVLAVVTILRRHGHVPGIVARGYKGSGELLEVTSETPAAVCGDEPLLLKRRSNAPVVVGRDRVAAARLLLERHPAVDVIVSDDGLQHLALARDAQVIVFDERGAGNRWLLPAGPLRVPMPSAVPPRSLMVYNAPRASTSLPGTLAERSLAGVVSLADWWQGGRATAAALMALRGRPLTAVAGLAHPQRFFGMLRAQGLDFVELALPDHDDYATLPWPAATADVVLTEKDAIKLAPDRTGATRVWVAPLDFALDRSFEDALIALLPPR